MIMRSLAAAAAISMLAVGAALAQAPAAQPVPAPAPAADAPVTTGSTPAAAEATPAAQPTETPASLADCQTAAAKLGEQADGKVLAEAKLEKLDELFGRLEALCDGGKFAETATVVSDIKAMIESN